MYISLCIFLGFINTHDTYNILVFTYINQIRCLIVLYAYDFFIHGLFPYSLFDSFFKGWWIIYLWKQRKNENEFVVSSVYNLRRLIFFVCNILAKFGSEDVELLKLLVGVCCTLGVDCAHVVLTGVLYIVICIIVRGVDGLRTNLGMMFEPLNLMYHHAPLRQ